MKYCSMKFVICVTVAILTAQTEAVQVIYGQVGGTVELPREVWGGKRVTITWTKNKSEQVYKQTSMGGIPSIGAADMKDRVALSRNDYSLVIKNLKPEDFTLYRCELTEGWKTDEREYRLYKITVSATPAFIPASQTLSLECNVEKSTVPTRIDWTGPKDLKTQGHRFISSGAVLTVTYVSAEHHGAWTCTVTYGQKTAPGSVSVTVVDFAPSPPQPLYPPQGSRTPSFLLPCSLHAKFDSSALAKAGFKGGHWSFAPFPWDGAEPERLLLLSPQLQWATPQGQKVNGTALETDLLRTNLSIVRKVKESGGTYTCALDFGNGVTLNRTLRVEVLRIVSSQGARALEGRELNLTCSLGQSSLNGSTLEWKPPRSSSISAHSGALLRQPLLSIPRVTEKEKGTWRCQLLRDDRVLATAELSLKTERAPVDVWLVVSICGAAVVLILLFVLIFICVRRHRQQKMFVRRRRKTKYCRCKHPQVKGFYMS